MKSDDIFKNFLFIVFFGVGMTSVFSAILSDEILNYYQLKINKEQTEKSIEEIIRQDKQLADLINDIEQNPDIVKHLAPLKIGSDINDPNAIKVELRRSELEQVKEALEKARSQADQKTEIPVWVKKCVDPMAKKVMFFAGTGLILVSFTCFSTSKRPNNA